MGKKKENPMDWILNQRKNASKILKPQAHYQEEFGCVAIKWTDKDVEASLETEEGILFDIAMDGEIIGVEILDLNKFKTSKSNKEN